VSNIIKSVITTFVVSTAITLLLLPVQPHYAIVFVLATIIQFVIFYIIGSIMEYIGEIKLKEINAFRLSELSKQSMQVECPCFKKVKEFVPINLNAKNTYKCSECDKTNTVLITIETAHTTDPIV
jgi:hypothetical protein